MAMMMTITTLILIITMRKSTMTTTRTMMMTKVKMTSTKQRHASKKKASYSKGKLSTAIPGRSIVDCLPYARLVFSQTGGDQQDCWCRSTQSQHSRMSQCLAPQSLGQECRLGGKRWTAASCSLCLTRSLSVVTDVVDWLCENNYVRFNLEVKLSESGSEKRGNGVKIYCSKFVGFGILHPFF